MTLFTACSSTSSCGLPDFSAAIASASYTVLSATDFLPLQHEPVHELRDEDRAVDGVGLDRARLDLGAARHD